jgi:peroxiredoxin
MFLMLAAGAKAPEFTLDNLSGGQSTLGDYLARGPVLLVLYKIGCPVCQLALPFLDRISKGSLQVVSISQDDPAATTRFRESFRITLPTLLDRKNNRYPASNAYGITSVPSLFLVEPEGVISFAASGFQKREIENLGLRSGVAVFGPEEHVPEWKAG